jgi:hypothetical protein
MPLYSDVLGGIFFYLKNSITHQINGDLELLKGFGINFLGSCHPLIYLYISWKKTRGRPRETPKKPCLNSWQGPSPPPSEFCTDEDNNVNRSAMDTWCIQNQSEKCE